MINGYVENAVKINLVNLKMKNKGAIETSVGMIVTIILAMSMLILGMALIKNLINSEESETSEAVFTIYQDVCVNKTTTDYYNFSDDFVSIDCPEELLETKCYDSNGNEMINLTCVDHEIYGCYAINETWNTNWDGIFTLKLKTIYTYYDRPVYAYPELTFYPYNYYSEVEESTWKGELDFVEELDFVDIGTTTYEDCNYEEVEEIDNCPKTLEDLYNNGEGTTYDNLINCSISKENLTIEWLNKNCETTQKEIPTCEVGTECIIDMIYKCGNYIVEVDNE